MDRRHGNRLCEKVANLHFSAGRTARLGIDRIYENPNTGAVWEPVANGGSPVLRRSLRLQQIARCAAFRNRNAPTDASGLYEKVRSEVNQSARRSNPASPWRQLIRLRIWRRSVLLWTIAVILHLPFPIVDHDPVDISPGANPAGQLEVELVMLGCDCPSDPDDGPWDHDSENSGNQGAFPQFLRLVFTAGSSGAALLACCCALPDDDRPLLVSPDDVALRGVGFRASRNVRVIESPLVLRC